ncbi:MAG: putative acyl-CoA transferase/carnitine dehydratase [Deltaproteobacteria bacterium]|nr:putative acyl-CoA transferase/carnitine dehydratase [Deltaproteobacteria bacterium]MBP2682167.1 putative acyl-CoA transferase/carnitine dehydratase [Deltaproteobacteria bacterium]
MDDPKIIGMAAHPEYARWAHRETDPEDVHRKPEALDDTLVLDVSHGSFAGLFASSLLAEMGAEVIRVEPPGGDLARKMTPYGMMIGDAGLGYITEGRNKLHITLDIASEEGKTLFQGLAKKADVLIHTFKPGRMEGFGLGYGDLREINPGMIYTAIHTYGQFGADAEKYANQPGYDILDQARGVIMSVTGEPDLDPDVPEKYKKPLKQGNWMGWYVGGAWASFGIQMALLHKRRTGKGQFIDVSPPEGLMAISNYVMQYFHMSGNQMPRAGNYDYAVFPYTYVKCRDGFTFISGFSDPNWSALCDIMNRPDLLEKFPTIKERLTPGNQPVIQHEIERFTVRYTSDEIQGMITEYGKKPDRKGTVVTGRLETPGDVLQREHWKERRTFVRMDDPHYGEVLVPNSSFKSMSGTPGRIKWACRPIGADNELVYGKYLGLGGGTLGELGKKGIV